MKDNEHRALMSAATGTAAIVNKDYIGAAASFLRGALELADEPTVRKLLNDEAVRRANAIGDAIGGERFK